MTRAAAGWLFAGAVGCGGGAALHHPAHTLPKGAYSAGAGVSNQFVLGDAEETLDRARAAIRTEPQPAGASERAQEGALTVALLAPGLAPWLGVRTGLTDDVELGATYFGRGARVDGRWALESPFWALSIGGGLSAIADRPDRAGAGLGGVEVGRTHGFGADIPLLVGYRTEASLIQVWLGARGGFEVLTGRYEYQLASGPEYTADIDSRRTYFGGLVGLGIGVRPIRVVVELNAAYQRLSGDVRSSDPGSRTNSVSLDGVTLSPSGALVTEF